MSVFSDVRGTAHSCASLFWNFWETQSEFLHVELKILIITLTILYVSSHATLHRPASAQPRKKGKTPSSYGDENEEEDEKPNNIGGLQPSDAIVFPIMASIALVGMYYVIQYLRKADLLNLVMRWYTSIVSVGSLVTLYSHGLQLATSFVFPRYWTANGRTIYRANQVTRRHHVWEQGKAVKDQDTAEMPLGPLPYAKAPFRLPASAQNFLWELRGLFTEKWILEIKVHGILSEKMPLRFQHGLAAFMAVMTILVYNLTNSALLSNILGLAFCYATQQLLSPTKFVTGFLVLIGLFVYDIVMVFYTYVLSRPGFLTMNK
jgi:minor histocompatibility antigen H13